jgi:hypothetical protein
MRRFEEQQLRLAGAKEEQMKERSRVSRATDEKVDAAHHLREELWESARKAVEMKMTAEEQRMHERKEQLDAAQRSQENRLSEAKARAEDSRRRERENKLRSCDKGVERRERASRAKSELERERVQHVSSKNQDWGAKVASRIDHLDEVVKRHNITIDRIHSSMCLRSMSPIASARASSSAGAPRELTPNLHLQRRMTASAAHAHELSVLETGWYEDSQRVERSAAGLEADRRSAAKAREEQRLQSRLQAERMRIEREERIACDAANRDKKHRETLQQKEPVAGAHHAAEERALKILEQHQISEQKKVEALQAALAEKDTATAEKKRRRDSERQLRFERNRKQFEQKCLIGEAKMMDAVASHDAAVEKLLEKVDRGAARASEDQWRHQQETIERNNERIRIAKQRLDAKAAERKAEVEATRRSIDEKQHRHAERAGTPMRSA